MKMRSRFTLLLTLAAALAACDSNDEAGDALPASGGSGGSTGSGGDGGDWTLQPGVPGAGAFAQDCDAQPLPGGTLENITATPEAGILTLRYDGDVKGYQVLVHEDETDELMWNLHVMTREGWETQNYDLNQVIGSPIIYGAPVFEVEARVQEPVPAQPLIDGHRYRLTIVRGCEHFGPVRADGTRWSTGTSAYDFIGTFLYLAPGGQ